MIRRTDKIPTSFNWLGIESAVHPEIVDKVLSRDREDSCVPLRVERLGVNKGIRGASRKIVSASTSVRRWAPLDGRLCVDGCPNEQHLWDPAIAQLNVVLRKQFGALTLPVLQSSCGCCASPRPVSKVAPSGGCRTQFTLVSVATERACDSACRERDVRARVFSGERGLILASLAPRLSLLAQDARSTDGSLDSSNELRPGRGCRLPGTRESWYIRALLAPPLVQKPDPLGNPMRASLLPRSTLGKQYYGMFDRRLRSRARD